MASWSSWSVSVQGKMEKKNKLHMKCVHHIGCSCEAASGNKVEYYGGEVLHLSNTSEVGVCGRGSINPLMERKTEPLKPRL